MRLRRRNGQKEWVEVFDWRLLESITEEEMKLYREEDGTTHQELGSGAHRREVWRRWLVGLV
jgi:DNA ligase-4